MTRRNSSLIAAVGIAVLLFAAACSPTTDEATTTLGPSTTSDVAADTSTTTAPATTTTTSTSSSSSTSTTTVSTTTLSPRTTTTTLAAPPNNKPPTITIISPANLSSHVAVYDASSERFGAAVSLSAVVSDADGDDVTVRWISSDEGALGTGESIVATLHTGQFDSAQPRITARATDQWGATTEATVQIIVWIPSDT